MWLQSLKQVLGPKSSWTLQVPSTYDATSPWINDDIRPLPPHRRTWGTWAFISWWSVFMFSITNWQIGASLVSLGLSVWQSMILIILSRIVHAYIAVLNGTPGGKWHIGFPVFSRLIWGVKGSYLPVVMRLFLGLFAFAFNTWFGGLCVTAMLEAMSHGFHNLPNHIPASQNVTTGQLTGWIVYCILNLPVLAVRPEKAFKLFTVFNGISLVTLVSIVIWALTEAHGAGPDLSQPNADLSSSALGWTVVKGFSTSLAVLIAPLMSQSDFSRFAIKPGDQAIGQWVSFVGLGSIMPLFGCLVASATDKLYGVPSWNPPLIILGWLERGYSSGTRAAAFFAAFGLMINLLSLNTVESGYSIGMDLAGLFPKYVNIRRGAYIGLFFSMALCPWQLLATADTLVAVLNGFSIFFTPICAIQICDYFLLRQRRVKLSDMFHPRSDGIYYYFHGFNPRTFVSWIVTWVPLTPGLAQTINPSLLLKYGKGLEHFYDLNIPYSFMVAFSTYYLINKVFPPQGLGEADAEDVFGTFGPMENRNSSDDSEPVSSVSSPMDPSDAEKQAHFRSNIV